MYDNNLLRFNDAEKTDLQCVTNATRCVLADLRFQARPSYEDVIFTVVPQQRVTYTSVHTREPLTYLSAGH